MSMTLKPSQLVQFLHHTFSLGANGKPCMIAGSPGIGKTAIINQVGDSMSLPVVPLILAQMDPTDVRGVLWIQDGRTILAVPKLFPDTPYVLFLDEVTNASPSMQNCVQQLVNERRIGDYTLPVGAKIVLAGNRTSDRAGSGRLTTAMASRMIHCTLVPDLQEFLQWGVQPKDSTKPNGDTNIHYMLTAYLRFKPEDFHNFDPTNKEQTQFTCPRTWEMISDIMYLGIADRAMRMSLYAGTVGDGVATQLVAFEDIATKIIPIDTILRNPHGAPLPDSLQVRHATCAALARHTTPKNLNLVLTYAKRLGPEYEFCIVSAATTRNPELDLTTEMTKWNLEHADVLS